MRALLLLVPLLLAGCNGENPPELTGNEAQLASTYAELLLHRERFGHPTSTDSLTLYRIQVDSILQAHGFTREQFLASFIGLVDTPEQFDPFFLFLTTDLQQKSGR